MENNNFSTNVTVFHERSTPEEAYLAGYAALLHAYELEVPLSDVLSLVSYKHKQVDACREVGLVRRALCE